MTGLMFVLLGASFWYWRTGSAMVAGGAEVGE